MAITLPSGFKITAQEPVDNRLLLTKAEMVATVDAKMPERYFAVCKDDGMLYLYNVNNSISSNTGKFRLFEGTGKTYTAGTNIQINADNVISATDTKYTAGTNVQISSNNVISATDTVYDDTAIKARIETNETDISNFKNGVTSVNSAINAMNYKSGGTIESALNGKQAKLTAGSNIQISSDNVISATDTIYDDTSVKNRLVAIEEQESTWNGKQDKLTAGANVTISDANVISATDTKYTAGDNITISKDNIISATSIPPVLTEVLTVGYNVGGIASGTVYATGTSIETILRDMLINSTPVGNKYLYYGVSATIPDDVSGMTKVEVTAEDLIANGYTYKNVTTNNEYVMVAVDNSLGISCYEISQSGFALGMASKVVGNQTIYYPDTVSTDTGARYVFKFEEA